MVDVSYYETEAKVPGAFTVRGRTRAQGTNVIKTWRVGSVFRFLFHRSRARAADAIEVELCV